MGGKWEKEDGMSIKPLTFVWIIVASTVVAGIVLFFVIAARQDNYPVYHLTCWSGSEKIYDETIVQLNGNYSETLAGGATPTITGASTCKRELIGYRSIAKHMVIQEVRRAKESVNEHEH